MTTKHRIKLIPARVKWFVKDLKGATLYYRRYKNLSSFVKKLEEAYLLEEKNTEINGAEFLEKKIQYEIAKKILDGKYNVQ